MRGLAWVEASGNRFALHDALVQGALEGPAERARELAQHPRRPDGLVLLDRDRAGVLRMTIWNRDGSRPETCGNALRCVARWAVERGHARSGRPFTVRTDAGARRAEVGRDGRVRVSMGIGRRVAEHHFRLGGRRLTGIECDLGNPHLVLQAAAWEEGDVERLGPRLEREPRFARGINVEFVTVGREGLSARIWERGVGETEACGSGACAIALALAPTFPAQVHLRGGTLLVEREGRELWLTTPSGEGG